ncbi:virulence factor Mce family protein [Luteitalea pratensis]|uniref:Virulence factor Mce family protein n=1 Tax=Luteitalea pratensis TaxID=1855912 RepID=A0A143PP90_LUTPR|nr:MlaD family protein [Luteitalea pratensis]AMY09983.1 virulence factor Mce family protein [Luteitalea pratensis]
MPRTRTLAWSQLKIGILAVAAFTLATMLIFAVGGDAGLFSGRYHLKTRFPNAGGLQSGSVVRLAGVNVGAVDDVYLDGAVVEVVLRVRPDVQNKITEHSIAQVGSVSLLGEGAVDITASTHGTPLKDWSYIRSGKTPGQIADVAENATQTLSQASALIAELRAGKGTVGKLVTEDDLYVQLNGVAKATEEVIRAIKQGKGPAGTLINNEAAARNLERALANLDQVTGNIAAGKGSIGTLINDDALAKSLSATTDNLRAVSAGLKNGDGTAGKLLTDNGLYNRLDSVVQRLDTLVATLNKGEGTAGRLLQDKQLYDNMNGAVLELRSLLAEIKKDPKKYLNVKVTIF